MFIIFNDAAHDFRITGGHVQVVYSKGIHKHENSPHKIERVPYIRAGAMTGVMD
ncbi:MAG TPA: hypothetical protein VF145_13545 [Chitinophagaceae bacterium]